MDLEDRVEVPDPVWRSLSSSLLQIGTEGLAQWVSVLAVLQNYLGTYKNIHKVRPYSGDSAPAGLGLGLGICIS